jgi:hypothetical protein
VTPDPLAAFREVWLFDFEFGSRPGGRPEPRCLVAREFRSGRVVRVWLDGAAPPGPPYPTGPDVLFVAYYASAELGCHLALGWPLPDRVLDLYAEFRCRTNGLSLPHGAGLLGALAHFGLPAMAGAEKDGMRDLALRGGPYTADERGALLAYCQSDVDALARLLPAMLPGLDLPRAVGVRGRYTRAVARMEDRGVPVDADALGRVRAGWDRVRTRLVRDVDADYGVYVPSDPADPDGPRSFSAARWGDYLARHGIPWPRLPSGALALDDDTFRERARAHPDRVGPIRELRHALGQLRLTDLAVGADGRNRCLLSPFASRTGRNQPSNSKFLFGASTWLRSLIRPGVGRAVAYVDYSQQELAIAAALSGDRGMMEAYTSGDFYLTFAKMAGAVPPGATKSSHPREREAYKAVALGVLYGLSEHGLAGRLGLAVSEARDLLGRHRRAFGRFWAWSEGVEEEGLLTGRLRTRFGWALHVPAGDDPETGRPRANPRSLRNFPVQAHGAEMMRLAACLATERGVGVCCPVHDAFLIEAAEDAVGVETGRMEDAMREASELVLPAFPLKTDAKIVRYPDRYSDPRGELMWAKVTRIVDGLAA